MEKSNYLKNIPCILNNTVREYDIQKANINILKHLGLISDDLYTELYNAPKQERQVRIGLMMREDNLLSKKLKDGITQAREWFVTNNSITDENILSIKNDAIFVIGVNAKNTKFSCVNFVLKHEYTSYYHLKKYEFYYNNEVLDVKGISDDSLPLHREYMLDLLSYIFSVAERVGGITAAISTLRKLITVYTEGTMPIGFYRELNPRSMFHTRYKSRLGDFFVDNFADSPVLKAINPEYVKSLDISYNQSILTELLNLYTKISFR